MTRAAPSALAIAKALDAVMRADRGRLLAALIARLGDFQLAEDALQEACMSALSHWGRSGLPRAPQGWLLRVALRKAIDRLRGQASEGRKAADLARLIGAEGAVAQAQDAAIPDERLRLIFACCHPALAPKTRVALTLRTVCGLTTPEVARAFLDSDVAMGQRLSRAKAKIAQAGIPFAVPDPADWAARLDGVLTTLYLIFTTGYLAAADEPRDLCAEALFLVRLLDQLRPDDPEIEGALALMLLTRARRAARIGGDGATVPPADQDRAVWNWPDIAQGRAILAAAMARRASGPFQIKAAISDCQMAEGGPDWPQIALLYHALWRFEPTPIVALNRAVARAESGDLLPALDQVEALEPSLAAYQPWHAARAALLARAGRTMQARSAYDRAIALCDQPADIAFLRARLAALGP